MNDFPMVETPQQVISALASIRAESDRGLKLLQDAETNQVQLELAAERLDAAAYLEATGTDTHRKTVAKVASMDAREAAELAKVRVNYIKTKLRHLSEATMSIQTSARMVELDWKTTK